MAAAYDSPDNTLPRVHAWLQAATLLFDHSTWVDLERRWVPALRDRGAVNTLIPVLFALGYNALRDGRLSAAEAALAEGRSLAVDAGNREWLDGFAVGPAHPRKVYPALAVAIIGTEVPALKNWPAAGVTVPAEAGDAAVVN